MRRFLRHAVFKHFEFFQLEAARTGAVPRRSTEATAGCLPGLRSLRCWIFSYSAMLELGSSEKEPRLVDLLRSSCLCSPLNHRLLRPGH